MANDAQGQGGTDSASFDAAWTDVRGDKDIQFVASTPKPPEDPPQWWTDFLEWLNDALAPLAETVVSVWPVLRIALLVLLAAGVLTLLWVILAPYFEQWHRSKNTQEEEWRPEEGAARQLLDEAEALARNGSFTDAVHLLLFRSIEDIERRRPELMRPSSTAREIGHFESLPENARVMFGVIAGHVERGIFAAMPIGEDEWAASRDAYAAFALSDTWRVDRPKRLKTSVQ